MRTFVEKILNAPAGSIVVREPDVVMSHDNSGRIRKIFEKMGGKELHDPARLLVVLDRKMTGTTEELVRDYHSIHNFMQEQQVKHFFDCDKGICHQLLAGQIKEGMLIAGNDSHTCTAGAFNCLAVGLNKTETAVLWKTGKMWFRVPETIKIVLRNRLPEGVYAKDLALWIMGMLRNEPVAYTCVEYHGEGVHSLSVADRMTIANVSAEMGVKSAVFPPDDTLADYFGDYAVQGVWADANAAYKQEFEIDLSGVTPLAMSVGQYTEVKSIREWGPLPVQQGLIGACATGRIEDIRVVAHILKDKKLAPGFQLSIVPASREIYMQAIEEGLIDMIFKSGAAVLGASCGPCLGSSAMIMADTRRYLTTTNSNSQQRMLSLGVEKFVASPATIAMTALTGVLTSPAEGIEAVYPYWAVPVESVSVHDFDNRLFGNVWNYKDIDHITTEQLLAEQWTYSISSEDSRSMLPYLLAGLDVTFAGRVKAGQILVVGENFGCGKLIEHAVAGLVAAGIEAVIARSVDRRFFRMAVSQGLPVIIAPEIVANYHSGDTLMLDWADKRIYLNREEYNLPDVDPELEKIWWGKKD